ncbi:hypothetical protein CC78DRAFT_545237 [Lojkania enalia]|uniref:Uncharacterized protein n=1 Tax=Lojkania enalia TaxID=147567 RepID=A0A9P4KAQ6_9PLEO|nr:hypothetical protein CC78DRAFT_545237 [Didymosphaeria enalia]
MAVKNTDRTLAEPSGAQFEMQETMKQWLTRHLRIPVLRNGKDSSNKNEIIVETTMRRPQTAPSISVLGEQFVCETGQEPPLPCPRKQPPPRPARPDSAVIRDVNAWLDASMLKPAPPLMGGIPYWREATTMNSPASNVVRYAVPIIREPDVERPTTCQNNQIASFCRRAKRFHVRVPPLLRTRSHRGRATQRVQTHKPSPSMPLLSKPLPPTPDEMQKKTARGPLHRSRSLFDTTRPSVAASTTMSRGALSVGQRQHLRPTTSRTSNIRDESCERRINAVYGNCTLRPATAGHTGHSGHTIPREDSIGNLSDAPTYFSGVPPPSYRSRAGSTRTTSSFGCVDGLNVERRQVGHQKIAHHSRGTKGKFKKLAQKAHLTK